MRAFHEVRSYDSDFMVWQSAYQDISFLAHWHQELELIYIRSGKARFRINDDEFTANAGDLVYVDTGDFHYSDSYDCKNILDFIIFDPGIISPHYSRANFVHPLITSEMLEQLNMADSTRQLFDQVSRELREKNPWYQELTSAMLKGFVYRLRRALPTRKESSVVSNDRMEMFYHIQRVLTYIDEHYNEALPLSRAASMMNFSESHFSKVFKKLVGLNYIAYLNAVRIEHSASMLRSTGAKVSDIALSCGFGNVRSFNRAFKKYTGFTPSEFLLLPDAQARNFSFYKRKEDRAHYVRNDSLTLIKNTPVP